MDVIKSTTNAGEDVVNRGEGRESLHTVGENVN
jgi:hypothetical protein